MASLCVGAFCASPVQMPISLSLQKIPSTTISAISCGMRRRSSASKMTASVPASQSAPVSDAEKEPLSG